MTYTFAEKRKTSRPARMYIHGGISVRPGGDSRELAACLSPVGFSSREELSTCSSERSGCPGWRSPDPFDLSRRLYRRASSPVLSILLSEIRAIPRITRHLERTREDKSNDQSTRTWRSPPTTHRAANHTCAPDTHIQTYLQGRMDGEREKERGGRIIIRRTRAGYTHSTPRRPSRSPATSLV